MNSQGANAVIGRLRDLYQSPSDADLARALGVGTSTVRNWRARNSIPWDLAVACAVRRGISLDWLILGVGPRQRADLAAGPTTQPPTLAAVRAALAAALADLDALTGTHQPPPPAA